MTYSKREIYLKKEIYLKEGNTPKNLDSSLGKQDENQNDFTSARR